MTYSTEDLIRILDQELKAAWRGDRLLLSSEDRVGVPIVSMALDLEQVGKVFACKDFTQQIHNYQLEQQVSGIIWRDLKVGEYELKLPEIHHQLIAIDSDKTVLQNAKETVMQFWWKITAGLNFWELKNHETHPLTAEKIRLAGQLAEWAEIDIGRDEVYLALCWGNPKECHYRWAYPDSGCDRLIAAASEPKQLNIF
ncbi:hypothetical protein Lepto7376_3268 [[Leptolyngbya] sp. PCC 7376]|uniref:hypothetical protein n=1 Tax=[Leptolyngbya] sp. PCC 7376 TaxID=111781 RepID=UPI00029F3734|nr:hypothetical protein [[Leptolyngbya] sp. PCC 7376]AFY39494.1 hypothetical protein Lepto7376_3268 [[Leptolyngbya] sp. PCC 7376]